MAKVVHGTAPEDFSPQMNRFNVKKTVAMMPGNIERRLERCQLPFGAFEALVHDGRDIPGEDAH